MWKVPQECNTQRPKPKVRDSLTTIAALAQLCWNCVKQLCWLHDLAVSSGYGCAHAISGVQWWSLLLADLVVVTSSALVSDSPCCLDHV